MVGAGLMEYHYVINQYITCQRVIHFYLQNYTEYIVYYVGALGL